MRKMILILLLTTAVVGAQEFKKEYADDPVCLVKTSMGDVYVELFIKEAPKTVQNFIQLAEGEKEFTEAKTGKKKKGHYYDNLIFHRVIKGFMIQGGCPIGTGTGDPGYKFEDEISASALGLDKIKAMDPKTGPHRNLMIRSREQFQGLIVMPLLNSMKITSQEELNKRMKEVNEKLMALTLKDCYEFAGYKYNDDLKSHHPKKGVLAMANSGPNTNGSQFFINLADTPWLAGKHTVFGKVIKGMEIVEKIGETKVGAGSKPVEDVKIISIRLYQGK